MVARLTVFMLLGLALVGVPGCYRIAPRPLAPEQGATALQARSLDDPGLRRFLEGMPAHAPEEWPLRRWDLDGLVLAALYFHPTLAVARAHAEVARAAVETAAMRPNPTLAVSPQLSTNPMGAVSPWLAAVSIDWPIETAGKRGHRIARADAAAVAAREAVMVAAWQVRRELTSSLVALAATTRQEDVLREETAVEERLVALLEARLREGAASAGAVAPIRLALLQSVNDRAAATAQTLQASARVAAALALPPAALHGVTLPSGFDPADEGTLAGIAPVDARRRAALERFDIRQAIAEYAATEATLRLELARQYPDVRLGPNYQFDQGQNKWGVALTIDLPLLNRNDGPIAEAAAMRDEAAARFVAMQAAALAEVEQALARRDGTLARRDSSRVALVDRERNLRRMRNALELGASDRVAELDAEIERLRAERAAAEAESAVQQALVDLDAALQGPIPGALGDGSREKDAAS